MPRLATAHTSDNLEVIHAIAAPVRAGEIHIGHEVFVATFTRNDTLDKTSPGFPHSQIWNSTNLGAYHRTVKNKDGNFLLLAKGCTVQFGRRLLQMAINLDLLSIFSAWFENSSTQARRYPSWKSPRFELIAVCTMLGKQSRARAAPKLPRRNFRLP
jgi:hypothetical protein